MNKDHEGHGGGSSFAARRARTWLLGLSLVGALWVAGSGCSGQGTEKQQPAPGVPEAAGAKKANIDANFCVDPPRLDLSKGNKDRYQWHNASSEDLLIVFVASDGSEPQPGTMLIPAHQFSSVYLVCRTCPEQIYEYRIHRLVSGVWQEAPCGTGAPTVPEVSVGP